MKTLLLLLTLLTPQIFALNQTIRGNLLVTGNTVTNGTTTGAQIGVVNGSSAGAGQLGEFIQSRITAAANFPATGVYGAATSISLTAGDWDVSALLSGAPNGATFTDMVLGISLANDSTGLTNGDNLMESIIPTGSTSFVSAGPPLVIPSWRVNVTVTTPVYLMVQGTYSAGQPKYFARLSARRVR